MQHTSLPRRYVYFILACIPLLFLSAYFVSSISLSQDADGMYLVTKMHGKEMPFKKQLHLDGPSPLFISSPAGDRLLVVLWENAGHTFYLTDRAGSFMKQVSRQHAPEGGGGVERGSINWSQDGNSIFYVESGAFCRGTCESPDDFDSVRYLYTIDVETFAETRVEIGEDSFSP